MLIWEVVRLRQLPGSPHWHSNMSLQTGKWFGCLVFSALRYSNIITLQYLQHNTICSPTQFEVFSTLTYWSIVHSYCKGNANWSPNSIWSLVHRDVLEYYPHLLQSKPETGSQRQGKKCKSNFKFHYNPMSQASYHGKKNKYKAQNESKKLMSGSLHPH